MEKSAVVFLHGFMGCPAQFDRLAELLEPLGADIYRPFLPGHGGSLADFTNSGVNQWLAFTSDYISGIAAQRILLVGHSMGGLLAINAAIERPERVCGIVALALPIKMWPSADYFPVCFGSLGPPRPNQSEETAAARRLCGVNGLTPLGAARLLPNTLDLFRLARTTRRKLPRLKIPLTVINSARDELVPASALSFARAALPVLRAIELKRASHFFYPENEQRLAADEIVRSLNRGVDE